VKGNYSLANDEKVQWDVHVEHETEVWKGGDPFISFIIFHGHFLNSKKPVPQLGLHAM
jgi:hypothetical protein